MSILDPDNDIARLRRRDDNARAIIAAIISNPQEGKVNRCDPELYAHIFARMAYKIADAMEDVRREGASID